MKITVVGMGYVGLSNALLLSQHNDVTVLDISEKKIELLNKKISPLEEEDFKKYLDNSAIEATLSKEIAYKNSDYVIIATPTDYDSKSGGFNTHSVDEVIKDILSINSSATIVIKSTVPIGYTKNINEFYKTNNIIFSPEFLREGKALYDNLYPSRIVVGAKNERAQLFAKLLQQGAIKTDVEIVLTDSTEAEAIKLFSNSYLAMRVSFFNEIDTFSEINKLESKDIIDGVCLDSRIGNHYNNPSFGYGGYCLPKDTKQLKNNYFNIPNSIVNSIVEANTIRKNFICDSIIKKKPKTVGVYRLIMKSKSDNFRESSTIGIIYRLMARNIKVIIYEPLLDEDKFIGADIVTGLPEFKQKADLIISNRITSDLSDVLNKVYSRDIYSRD